MHTLCIFRKNVHAETQTIFRKLDRIDTILGRFGSKIVRLHIFRTQNFYFVMLNLPRQHEYAVAKFIRVVRLRWFAWQETKETRTA